MARFGLERVVAVKPSPFAAGAREASPRIRTYVRRILLVLAATLLLPDAFVQAQLPGLPRLPGTSAPAAAVPAAAPGPTPAPPAAQAIPLPQIADKAEDLDRRLEAISQDLTAEQEAISPKVILGNQGTEIRDRALHVDSFIHNLPDILQLRDEVV
jgi:potassium-dependent mechanosensitive channel